MTTLLNKTHIGDCRKLLAEFAAAGLRVNTCVTSPPYFGLRDYGHAGQIGLEPTPSEYVAELVAVFRLVRNLLADDGTLWLNLGDSYAGSWGAQGRQGKSGQMANRSVISARQIASHPKKQSKTGSVAHLEGIKAKDLMGIPWRVAFALQADGWYLRSDIIWHKPNPMPESVTDRPTKAHEYLFLLAKSERYYYDSDAIKEPDSGGAAGNGFSGRQGSAEYQVSSGGEGSAERWEPGAGRNRRSVWVINTQPFSGAHFATFPRALIEPCVLASTSQRGHCKTCGAGWSRQVDSETTRQWRESRESKLERPKQSAASVSAQARTARMGEKFSRTIGWQKECECASAVVPGIVLDPFMGSGTTGQVATDLGRNFIGCELNPKYVELHELRRTTIGMSY